MFNPETDLIIQQKIREELTLREKIQIANEEEDNFTAEEKKEIEKLVQEYFNKNYSCEKIEKARKDFRDYARKEIRKKYAQRFLTQLIEKI